MTRELPAMASMALRFLENAARSTSPIEGNSASGAQSLVTGSQMPIATLRPRIRRAAETIRMNLIVIPPFSVGSYRGVEFDEMIVLPLSCLIAMLVTLNSKVF